MPVDPSTIGQAALDAAASWVQRFAKRGRRLAPWDEFQYFDLPIVTSVAVPGAGSVQLVGVEVRRQVLIFHQASGPAAIISPVDPGNTGPGIIVVQTNNPVTFTQKEYGSLCQLPWFARTTGGGSTMSVIQLNLREWPG